MTLYEPHPDNFTSVEDAKEFVRNLKNKFGITIEYDEDNKLLGWKYWKEGDYGDWQDSVSKDVDNFLDYCEKELLEDPKDILDEVYNDELDKLMKEF